MPNIKITVAGKIATNTTPGEVIVCGNSDYTVTFDLDAEWAAEPNHTARFVYYKNGLSLYQDVEFTGNTVAAPVLSGISYVLVGIYAGNLHTTTPAKILCDRSILCGDPDVIPPTVKEQLQAQIDNLADHLHELGVDVAEPAEDDVPKVFFGDALPQTKDDVIMTFRYVSKTKDIRGYCKTKAQGTSSMGYPKKNQTVKLYKDADCTEKLKINFRGWGEQNKFCFKANWIDLTHARNIVSARLWGAVVKSRANYADIPEKLRRSPNHGAVDGFPVKVYAGGVYLGRYTVNIPKDAWMANMDDKLDTHCILCGEGSNVNRSSLFDAEAVLDGTDWSDEIHDTAPEVIKTAWNETIRFVMNSTDEEFVEGIREYFDLQSLVDYYVFGIATCNFDGFNKNQLYMTYNGRKWYASAYDLDSTFGLHWNGSSFVDSALSWYVDNYNKLYTRLEQLFPYEIATRWNELKSTVLSVDNIMAEFEKFIDVCPPWLVAEDYAETTGGGAFTAIPSQNVNNIQQIRSFVVARRDFTEDRMSGLLPAPMYILDEDRTLDGTSYINTGVTLDQAEAYTVLLDFTVGSLSENSTLIDYQRAAEDGTYLGWRIDYWSAWPSGALLGSNGSGSGFEINPAAQTGVRDKFVMKRDTDGSIWAYSPANSSGMDVTSKISAEAVGQTVVIGADHYPNEYGGIYQRNIVATIHGCEIWGKALTDAEIKNFLER